MSLATREAYGQALAQLVVERKEVVVLDADLTKSTKTIDAQNACREHHFNMGIAEGNMMGVAAGLAASDKIVYASSFAMFCAGRAFEQIRNSIAYPKLNVNICATHAGISVGEDGASHQAIEDIALMRSIPNMCVLQPCDAIETKAMIKAVADIHAPCYVRLGRLSVADVNQADYQFQFGKGVILHKGSKVALIASGLMVQESLKAMQLLPSIDPTLINIHTIKPFDTTLIKQIAQSHDILISIEEHSVIGGLGSAIAECLAPLGLPCKQYFIGMQDCFGRSGKPKDVLAHFALDADHIAQYIKNVMEMEEVCKK